MSLEKWLEYGWLKREPTSRDEIRGLLAIVVRDLKDANVAAISDDRRFEAGFNAARTLANAALRASGYRTSTQPGHHQKTIESLELTIQADTGLINRLRAFSRKRNAASYDSAGTVSKQELEAVIKTAAELESKVMSWLQKNHPELLKD
ncbi:MAG TPA: DNA-binding protein [Candidatus Angelobacter sp.]|nr:DNA-binding protein [Candidatus Angelobacter sp.]